MRQSAHPNRRLAIAAAQNLRFTSNAGARIPTGKASDTRSKSMRELTEEELDFVAGQAVLGSS